MNIAQENKASQNILAKKDFILDANNRKIMAALNSDGLENARYVGGCVRNSLLGAPVKDIDIATKLWPREIIAQLEAHNIRYVPTGIEYGTISAIIDNRAIEITTLRRDVKTDGRRAKVQYTDDWTIDAQRRDFTFNALYCDSAGRVYDPLGTGIDDALARKTVFIGKACERIREDYLRILRFFRLYAWYGKGELDSVGLDACRHNLNGLSTLSAERIWSEIKKLLAAPNPIHAIEKMEEIGIFDKLIGVKIDIDRFKALVTIENEIAKDADEMLRFIALLDQNLDFEKCAIGDKLKFSNDEKKRMLFTQKPTPIDWTQEIGLQIKTQIYYFDRRATLDAIILQWSMDKEIANYGKWHQIYTLTKQVEIPVFPIGGKDLIEFGIKKGPQMGKILAQLENWWIQNGFEQQKHQFAEKIEQIIKQSL